MSQSLHTSSARLARRASLSRAATTILVTAVATAASFSFASAAPKQSAAQSQQIEGSGSSKNSSTPATRVNVSGLSVAEHMPVAAEEYKTMKESTQVHTGTVRMAIREDPTTANAVLTEHAAIETDEGFFSIPDALAAKVEHGQVATISRHENPLAQVRTTTLVSQANTGVHLPGNADPFGVGLLAGAKADHDVTVVMAVPPGFEPDGAKVEDFKNLISGQVASYWNYQTNNEVNFRVTRAEDWIRVNTSCKDPFGFWQEVADKVNWQPEPSAHLMVYLPQSAAGTCGVGLGTVGKSHLGSLAYVAGPMRADVLAHEFGHNLGLGHANALKCPDHTDAKVIDKKWNHQCTSYAYGDFSDVMGISHGKLGSLSSVNQHRLGVRKNERPLLTESTEVVISAAHSHSGQSSAMIKAPSGDLYFIEYRESVGENDWLTSRGINQGIQIRRIDPFNTTASVVLDASPSGSQQDQEVSLEAGQTVELAEGKINIGVISAAEGAAVVQVMLDQGVEWSPKKATSLTPKIAPKDSDDRVPTKVATNVNIG